MHTEKLSITHPHLALEWHPTRNHSLTPDNVSVGSNKKVWWQCSKGHEWEATVSNRSKKGHKCPICSNKKLLKGYNDLLAINPALSKEWHPARNGDLKPSDVFFGSGEKAWWQCEKGHEWEAQIYLRNKGYGCPICSKKKVLAGYNDLATTHPQIAKEWHPTKNVELKPSMVFAGTLKSVWWLCERCGYEWKAQINSRKQGNGCPECKKSTVAIATRKTAVKKRGSLQGNNPELAKEWHSEKNKDLTPAMIPSGSGQKVWWMCEKGHEWEATVASRNTGLGCPTCSKETRSSFPEQAIYYYMNKMFDSVINSYRINKRSEIDIYIETINLGIEYDGEAWHKKAEKDLRKNLLCREKGINLIRVREEKCPSLNDGTFCIGVKSNSSKSLEIAIKQICEYINENVKSIDDIDVDIDRDTSDINNLLIQKVKENSVLTAYPELASEWHPVKNGSLMPDMVTSTSGRKVWWLGICGHEWQVRVDSRVFKQSGCPVCDNKQVLAGFNDLATINPELANQWHPTKNGNLKPTDVAPKSDQKVWWICDKGHEFEASMNNRFKPKGTNCPYCANQKLLVGFNDLATVVPELAVEWHPTKNGDLRPSDIVPGYNKKVWWRCKKGHEWAAVVDNRYRGRGCPGCVGRLLLKGVNDLATINPTLASEWHPTKNGNIKPDMIFPNTNKKAWWLGKCGHEWEGIVNGRNNGGGCPYCCSNKVLQGFNDLATVNSELAAEWHPTMNVDLKPTDVTKASGRNVWWKCKRCGNEWEKQIKERTRGIGCPKCNTKK